ncbi:hypothetical protein [Kitasatospora sp. NPDC002040]|uniref:hypothetical protein n=1 Tax=Kitasatospora sp. NPDC002040 TaxID=3154661 RepID=UPI0033332084
MTVTSDRPGRQHGLLSAGWLPAAPVLALVGTLLGTRWTTQAWADCPLGNDAAARSGLLLLTVPAVWLLTTALLIALQFLLRAKTGPDEHLFRWVVVLAAAVVLTLLYRAGMGWPEAIEPGGPCMQGWPLFPFGSKPGPGPQVY